MSDKTNVMPNNLDAEQALLGCMLIDNEILADVLDGLDKKDFYHESHQYIISAIKMIFAERKPLDIVTLSDRLDSDGNLEKAGGISYITELTQITPSAANFKFYLDIVKRDSINRSLIRAAREIAEVLARDVTGNGATKAQEILAEYSSGDADERNIQLLCKLIIETLAHLTTK